MTSDPAIFLVCGKSGDYEAYRTWVVAAYARAEPAQEHARLAKAEADRLFAYRFSAYEMPEYPNPYDPHMEASQPSTRTSYWVEGLPVRREVPTVTLFDVSGLEPDD